MPRGCAKVRTNGVSAAHLCQSLPDTDTCEAWYNEGQEYERIISYPMPKNTEISYVMPVEPEVPSNPYQSTLGSLGRAALEPGGK